MLCEACSAWLHRADGPRSSHAPCALDFAVDLERELLAAMQDTPGKKRKKRRAAVPVRASTGAEGEGLARELGMAEGLKDFDAMGPALERYRKASAGRHGDGVVEVNHPRPAPWVKDLAGAVCGVWPELACGVKNRNDRVTYTFRDNQVAACVFAELHNSWAADTAPSPKELAEQCDKATGLFREVVGALQQSGLV